MGLNLTPVVRNLLIVNVVMFVLSLLIASQFHIRLQDELGLHYINSELFQPIQLFTHMFMHADFMHLFFNMFALFMFGPALESVWGTKRFLLFYMVCGLGAAVLQSGVNYVEMHQLEEAKNQFISNPTTSNLLDFSKKHGGINPSYLRNFQLNEGNAQAVYEAKEDIKEAFTRMANIPMVGASGAIFGILLGFGMLFPNTILMLLFPPIPIKAKYFVLIYGLIELYSGMQRGGGDNVAHFAHLGGMLFGFILIKYWQRNSNSFY